MTAPATDQFVETLHKSGLFNRQFLDEFLKKHAASGMPRDPETMLKVLIRDGQLTEFQAKLLLLGRSRGFLIRNRYKVLDQLGAGGMGAVYLCEDNTTKTKVAIKVLPPQQARDKVALERFRREARAVAVLSHTNIVRALETDQDGDLHFLAMEHVTGVSLQQLVQQEGPLEPVRAANCILQAALGLEHAHRAGLVHRDIKPANLLLDQTGTIKVLDLGLARFFNDEKDKLTQEHDSAAILGTADYIAPEQAVSSHDADIRADIYSLGCTFYFLLSGEPPFAGKTVTQKLIFHQTKPPPPIRDRRPEVPEDMAAVVNKMLAKTPEERYQVPMEVAQALKQFRAKLAPPGSVVMRIAGAIPPPGGGNTPGEKGTATKDNRATTAKGPAPKEPTEEKKEESPADEKPAAARTSIKERIRAVREGASKGVAAVRAVIPTRERVAQVRETLRTRRRLVLAVGVALLGLILILAVLMMGGSSSSPTPGARGEVKPGDDGPTRGLKDHWKLDDGSGTVAQSTVGGGSRLQLNGGTWDKGFIGGGVRFNGQGQYLSVADSDYDVGNSFTLTAWIAVNGDAKDTQTLFANKPAGPEKTGFHFGVNNPKTTDRVLFFNTGNGKDNNLLKSAENAVAFISWQHVAVAVNRTDRIGRLYVNGSDVTAPGSAVLPDFQTKGPLRIGIMLDGAAGFNGAVDDLRVYTRVLDRSEIEALAKRSNK